MKRTSLLPLAALAALPQWAVSEEGKYDVCVNYYTSGDVRCAPQAPGLLQPSRLAPADAPQLLPPPGTAAAAPQPPALESEVDKYLENYGKPPREFVEFYLNPTRENAMKWVATYQQMLQRGKALSTAWGQADELYQQGGYGAVPTSVGGLPPVPNFAITPTVPAPTLQPVSPEASQPAPAAQTSIGAFASRASGATDQIGGVPVPVTLTYYFSATCPYCEKMTPELNEIQKEKSSELKLTCVDVTPLGPTARADPANISDKLPCNWRMPAEGEVERVNVSQTPTLLIQRGDAAPMRLSGYVPLAQLRQYILGQAKP